jgi:hypothetical protein
MLLTYNLALRFLLSMFQSFKELSSQVSTS